MSNPTNAETPRLTPSELEMLETERKRKKSSQPRYDTYGTHTHTSEPTAGHRSETLHTSLVRHRHHPKNYPRSLVTAIGLAGIAIGALLSFAITHNFYHLLIGIAAGISALGMRYRSISST